jgi:ABC-type multidrug transport system fused ATPase/permease subunit
MKVKAKSDSRKRVPGLDIDAQFVRYLFVDRPLVAAAAVATVFHALMNLAAPWPMKYIIDNVISGRPHTDALGKFIAGVAESNELNPAFAFGLLLILVAVFTGLFNFLRSYLEERIMRRAVLDLRGSVLRHTQALPMRFHDSQKIGDIANRINSDPEKVIAGMLSSIVDVILNSLRFIGVIVVLLYTNPVLSVVPLVFSPLLLIAFVVTRKKMRAANVISRDEEGKLVASVIETLGSIRIVKAFLGESRELERYTQRGVAHMNAELRAKAWSELRGPIVNILKATALMVCVMIGVSQIAEGTLTIGALIVYLNYLSSFYDPLEKFNRVAGALQKASISAERLETILGQKPVDLATGAIVHRPGRRLGALRFENVSFGYDNKRPYILDEINFELNPGQKLGIVGSTGSGKSTIVNLLLRFYEPKEGEGKITIDGVDTREMQASELRKNFALVTQDPILFGATVRENIAYGKKDATLEQIENAARVAHAHGFVQKLANGYDTVIGERGSTLSGGQRQRLALARAVLADAPILILDEPTAALDALSERDLLEALTEVAQRRTTIIISHRLSAVRDCDLILVLEHGHVVEQGNYDDLIARDALFAELWRTQFGIRNEEPTVAELFGK